MVLCLLMESRKGKDQNLQMHKAKYIWPKRQYLHNYALYTIINNCIIKGQAVYTGIYRNKNLWLEGCI